MDIAGRVICDHYVGVPAINYIIEKGYFADITVFNPKTVNSLVSFTNPFQYSEGIEYIIINGKMVLENDKYYPEVYAGKVLRRN